MEASDETLGSSDEDELKMEGEEAEMKAIFEDAGMTTEQVRMQCHSW